MIKVAFVALMVGAFMATILNIIIPGIYGLGITWMRGSYDLTGRIDTVWTKPSPHPMTDIAPWISVGFVFVVVMKLLEARFLWIPDTQVRLVFIPIKIALFKIFNWSRHYYLITCCLLHLLQ
jgi:hypothetical protein